MMQGHRMMLPMHAGHCGGRPNGCAARQSGDLCLDGRPNGCAARQSGDLCLAVQSNHAERLLLVIGVLWTLRSARGTGGMRSRRNSRVRRPRRPAVVLVLGGWLREESVELARGVQDERPAPPRVATAATAAAAVAAAAACHPLRVGWYGTAEAVAAAVARACQCVAGLARGEFFRLPCACAVHVAWCQTCRNCGRT